MHLRHWVKSISDMGVAYLQKKEEGGGRGGSLIGGGEGM